MSKLSNKMENYFKSHLRAFPTTIIVFSILTGIIFRNKTALFLGTYVGFSEIIGGFLKLFSKSIYKSLNKESIPLLGIGKRPINAKYTGCFITEDNLDGKSLSFGMPSGHSIASGVVCVFLFLYILKTMKPSKKRNLSLFTIGAVCGAVAFSRIFLKCHTIQQVIVGFLIGGFLGYIGFHFYWKFLEE